MPLKAIISDIHSNLEALEACLAAAPAHDVVVNLGDLVGYGTHADEVVELIRERSIPCVRGNHDRWALERRQVIGLRGWKGAAFRPETWEFLAALPTSLSVAYGSRRVAVYHGSPAADTEYVTPYKPIPETVDRFWDQGNADVLVLGHSHIPMVERTERGTLLNPGSILGVTGVQTSYSFAVVELEELTVRWYEIRTGRELRRDPIFLEEL